MGRLSYKMTPDSLKQNKEELKNSAGYESPFLKAEEGVKFRILPNTFVPEGESWFQMVLTHSNLTSNGKFVTVKCAKTDDPTAPCPICNYVSKSYGGGEVSQGTKDILSKIGKKTNWYVPVYVRSGQYAGQIRWWKLNKDNIDKIVELGNSKRTANFHDIYDGADLEMKVDKKKFGLKEFNIINFKVEDDDKPLAATDNEMEKIINSIEPLSEHILSFSYDDLKVMLGNFLSASIDESSISTEAPEEIPLAANNEASLNDLLQSV